MTDIKRLIELAGLTELKQDQPFIELDRAASDALSYYQTGKFDSLEDAAKYFANIHKVDYDDLLATSNFYLKHPEALKNDDVEEGYDTEGYFVWGFSNKRGRYKITGITKDERGVFDIQMGKNGVWYDPKNNSGKLKFSSLTGQPLSAEMIYNRMNKEENIGESTPTSDNYLDVNQNKSHEIEWLKKKIISLRPKFEGRPSTIKELRDLERQIKERGGVPDVHDWYPSGVVEETHGFIAGDRVRHLEQPRTGTVRGYEHDEDETAVEFDDEPGEIYFVDNDSLELTNDNFTRQEPWNMNDPDAVEEMDEPSDAEMFGATELTDPIEGLEGPWRMKNGRTVYYDPKEGKYYDRGMDMYLSQDEANELHVGNMREEYDTFKEADPFGGAMTSPYGNELDDSVLDDAIENAQYEANQFHVDEYSSDPDDYEGQLEAIIDEIIGSNADQEVREIDDWYAIMTQALEPVIGPKLKAHMGMTEESDPMDDFARDAYGFQHGEVKFIKKHGIWVATNSEGSRKIFSDEESANRYAQDMTEENLNEFEKAPKFAWFEPSKGPENFPGFELRYLEPNPNYDPASTPSVMKDGPFYTPSFGWWKSVEDYQAGGASFSGKTKDEIEAEHNMQWLPDRPSQEEGIKLLQLTNEGLEEGWRDKFTSALQTDADKLHDQAAAAAASGDQQLSNKLMRQYYVMLQQDREQGKYSLGNNPRFHPTIANEELSRLQHLAGIEEAGVGVLTAQNTTADVKKGTLQKQGAKFGFNITDMGIPPRISKDSGNK